MWEGGGRAALGRYRLPHHGNRALYWLGQPTGSALLHPVTILPTQLHVKVPNALPLNIQDHRIPQILGEGEVANRP